MIDNGRIDKEIKVKKEKDEVQMGKSQNEKKWEKSLKIEVQKVSVAKRNYIIDLISGTTAGLWFLSPFASIGRLTPITELEAVS